ncbi:hypothetical protein [Polaromonas hydrogenivorans]|uniref:Uncharacterized protein n=1 Tax=Polaromonas hydrogenivorans TaxID=335476 RepID=A0AAU7LWX1_9BURK
METNLNGVYKKSTKGWDELKMRAAGLDAAARSMLILINGMDSLAAVERKLGRDILPPLEVLQGLGLVERLETSKPARAAASSPPPVQSEPPASPGKEAVPPAPPDANDKIVRWNAVRRQVMVRLAPSFGPDLMTVLAPLMKADSDASFLAAINALETKIAMYQGKKAAVKLLEGLRP